MNRLRWPRGRDKKDEAATAEEARAGAATVDAAASFAFGLEPEAAGEEDEQDELDAEATAADVAGLDDLTDEKLLGLTDVEDEDAPFDLSAIHVSLSALIDAAESGDQEAKTEAIEGVLNTIDGVVITAIESAFEQGSLHGYDLAADRFRRSNAAAARASIVSAIGSPRVGRTNGSPPTRFPFVPRRPGGAGGRFDD